MQHVLHFSDSTLLSTLRDMLTAFRMTATAKRTLAQSLTTKAAAPFTEVSKPVWQGQWRTIKYL